MTTSAPPGSGCHGGCRGMREREKVCPRSTFGAPWRGSPSPIRLNHLPSQAEQDHRLTDCYRQTTTSLPRFERLSLLLDGKPRRVGRPFPQDSILLSIESTLSLDIDNSAILFRKQPENAPYIEATLEVRNLLSVDSNTSSISPNHPCLLSSEAFNTPNWSITREKKFMISGMRQSVSRKI
ncbi:hypothetical protein PCANC_24927 [Puccinia coronata f. sp. avenae]|uniref:Uncharacterized protein n=1 Tax=Puccinia coronata f. sp. avenae TaxID=200324 RepID=A0A2N5TU68_9BASI|nr:hypothetical protein PCANC_24927 [Puccinia coronata f. sp. avenae]